MRRRMPNPPALTIAIRATPSLGFANALKNYKGNERWGNGSNGAKEKSHVADKVLRANRDHDKPTRNVWQKSQLAEQPPS